MKPTIPYTQPKAPELTPKQWSMLLSAAHSSTDMLHVDFGQGGRDLSAQLRYWSDWLNQGEEGRES